MREVWFNVLGDADQNEATRKVRLINGGDLDFLILFSQLFFVRLPPSPFGLLR